MTNRYFKRRFFYLNNIGCTIKVEQISRKEMLGLVDNFIDCVHENNYYKRDMNAIEDETYEILYKDGTIDYIDDNYDGHKIKRTNIVSIVNCNAESDVVYGNFTINADGVIHTAIAEQIDDAVREICE